MLAYPQKISLCGFGGQGIILSAVILGTTAVTKGNLYAVQTQSYGSEARGGQCQAELIIDREKINSPIAETKNLLVALFRLPMRSISILWRRMAAW
ncbi:MAG: 2-oxoacid:acceptor oxidoreductase family protein [Blautia sp.]